MIINAKIMLSWFMWCVNHLYTKLSSLIKPPSLLSVSDADGAVAAHRHLLTEWHGHWHSGWEIGGRTVSGCWTVAVMSCMKRGTTEARPVRVFVFTSPCLTRYSSVLTVCSVVQHQMSHPVWNIDGYFPSQMSQQTQLNNVYANDG